MTQVWILILLLDLNQPIIVGKYSSAMNCSAAAENSTTNGRAVRKDEDWRDPVWFCVPDDKTVSGKN